MESSQPIISSPGKQPSLQPHGTETPSQPIDLLASFLDEIANSLLDPISLELMTDPVITSDMMTYDRDTIERWFQACRRERRPYTSPVTNQVLPSDILRTNSTLKLVLDSTIKFLEGKETENNLPIKGQEVLSQYRAILHEKQEAIRIRRETEKKAQALRLRCCRGHTLSVFGPDCLPASYAARFNSCTVSCDLCEASNIEQGSFYMNCEACRFDLCGACALRPDTQERILPPPTIIPANPFPQESYFPFLVPVVHPSSPSTSSPSTASVPIAVHTPARYRSRHFSSSTVAGSSEGRAFDQFMYLLDVFVLALALLPVVIFAR